MPKITESQMRRQIDGIPTAVMTKMRALAYADKSWTIAEIIALASRETNCQNIEGDGGHGKGGMQIDIRSHGTWLSQRAGCKSGTNQPVKGRKAIEPGFVPTWGAGVIKALLILNSNLNYAKSRVPKGRAKAAAIAGYNCGIGAAISSMRRFGHPDAYTTGKDYSTDVAYRVALVEKILSERE